MISLADKIVWYVMFFALGLILGDAHERFKMRGKK